jgi:hypothetical protein
MLDGGDYGTPGMGNDACLDFTCALDSVAAAADLDGDGVDDIGSYLGDTIDSENNFEHSCGYTEESGPDDAYSFTAEEDGCYNFYTSVADWSPVISAQTDCSGGEISCGDSSSSLDWETWTYYYSSDLTMGIAAGETAMIVVDGADMSYGDWGSYELEVSEVEADLAPTAGGDLISATGDGVATGSTEGEAVVEEGSCAGSGGSVVYDWTAPSEGCWFFDLSDSEFDTKLAVYSGGGLCGASESCNDDYYFDGAYSSRSGLEIDLSEGEVVTVLVGGYGSSEGLYSLDINPCVD